MPRRRRGDDADQPLLPLPGVERIDPSTSSSRQQAAVRLAPRPTRVAFRKRPWVRKAFPLVWMFVVGSGGIVTWFAEGTRDALRDAAIAKGVAAYRSLTSKPTSVALAPTPAPALTPAPTTIETGSIGASAETPAPKAKRTSRKKASKPETNPFIVFGMRIGAAVDEFFGYGGKN